MERPVINLGTRLTSQGRGCWLLGSTNSHGTELLAQMPEIIVGCHSGGRAEDVLTAPPADLGHFSSADSRNPAGKKSRRNDVSGWERLLIHHWNH